jgi:hypothetical protein
LPSPGASTAVTDVNFVAIVGVTGTIVGALIGAFSASLLESWKRRKQQRQALAAEIARLGHNYMATLQDMESERALADVIPPKTVRGDLTRQDGALIALQFQAWALFKSRPVRAAFMRLLSRAGVVADHVSSKSHRPEEGVWAIAWFKEGLGELITECASAGGVPMRDRGGITFIGWRSVTPADKRRLSFDDDPPPWEFSLTPVRRTIHWPPLEP